MFETVLIATDGSTSAERAVRASLDLADRFDATVHGLYVVDSTEVAASPDAVRDDLERALATAGGRALTFVREAATEDPEDGDVVTAVREGDPIAEICRYADEHGFLLGSVAEGVVRRSAVPVMTVRQLEGAAADA